MTFFLCLGVVIIYKAGVCVYSTCASLCLKVKISFSSRLHNVKFTLAFKGNTHRTIPSSPGESSDTESAEEEETEDMEGLLGSRFKDRSQLQCDKFQNRARCVVCQLERVTRAALPCRYHERNRTKTLYKAWYILT